MLYLDAAAGSAIAALIARAQDRPRSAAEVRRRTWETVRGYQAPRSPELTIALPGFEVTFAIELLPGGPARHLAVAHSVEHRGTTPDLMAVISLAQREFGFGPFAGGQLWLEAVGNNRRSWHLLQPITPELPVDEAPADGGADQYMADPEDENGEEW